MADENKPAFYPRVGRNIAKNFRSAQPAPFVNDPRAMDLPQFGDIDLSVPNKANMEMARRMAERDAQLKRQQSADTSPLEKAAGALQSVRLMGSALTQAINSMPTRIAKGDEAADKFMQERMYKPEQPLAYEYAQDIGNMLERLETEYKIPPVLPEAMALQYLASPATSQATRAAGRGAEQAGMALERRMEPVVRGALEQGGLPREMALAMGANSQSNVIKPKGGNWLTGSVERSLKPLKRNTAGGNDPTEILRQLKEKYTPEELAGMQEGSRNNVLLNMDILEKDVALNNWVDRNLANYVKKEMATPDDPVRKLSEEGISHLPTDTPMPRNMSSIRALREEAGFPKAMGISPQAQVWEALADKPIRFNTAGEAINIGLGEPWMEKVDPFTRVHRTATAEFQDMSQNLGFDHIVDVLREDVAAGRIRPDQLNKVSMEQAVRRTYEYDQELARKMNEARATARAELPVHKDYPEGFKWVQLNRPSDFASESDAMGHSVRGYEPPVGHPDWVEGSGDMGNLGYGYGGWEGIKSGRAKVYSLIDSKGQPHVTIETKAPDLRSNYDELQPLQRQADLEADAQNFQSFAEREKFADKRYQELKAQMMAQKKPEGDYTITQIKGKQNAAPKDDYLSYVQDFVRGGNWADVRDFQNTGLAKLQENSDLAKWLQEKQIQLPKYPTKKELDNYEADFLLEKLGQKEFDDLGLGFLKGEEGMKRGGVVVSNNPDTMMLELGNQKMKNGVPAYGAGKAVIKKGLMAARPAVSDAERALPLVLPRAMPKSKAEINAHAERVARQMLGEHVTSGKAGDTKNLAGRSLKESQRVKNLEYEIVPTKDVPESQPIQSQIGDINVALPGDFTLSDVELKSLMGEPINSRQEGGSRYGLGHLEDELPLFYASNEGPAQMVQNKVSDLYSLYEPERVMGQHMAMGPIATNFAQHFADANLKYTDYSKLRGADMDMFDQIMSQGYEVKKKNKKTGEVTIKVVDFPNWPGIADPQAAYEAMKRNPEMRKFYNRIMQTPSITEPLGFPSGQDVRYAITSPDLRDMEVNLVGHGVGELVPNVDLTDTANHNTYAKGIRGIYKGHQDVLSPFAIAYPDATQHIITHQRPQDFTGTIQKVFPHQRVDQQFIDEMEQYRRRIKELTGKKKGGAIKQPAAYIDGSEFWEAAKKYGIRDSMNNLNMIVNLVNKGLTVDDAARQVADSGMHKAAGGAITGDDLIIEERPL